jgi:peptidoglycan/xylan/chitin deacetylase (PgdA/CDA1 family)
MKFYRNFLFIFVAVVSICVFLSTPLSAGNSPDTIPVLAYHRVGYTSDPLTVTPEQFKRDLSGLQQQGYETISINSFEDYMSGKEIQLPSKPILITFDDSYQDNYVAAFPILRQYHAIATFFVITGVIDKSPDRLSSSEILEMSAAGMSFGSHTVTHTPLGQEPDEWMRNELLQSKQFLEALLKTPINTIAYPEGNYTTNTIKIANEVGYTEGFSVKPGICNSMDPHFVIPRVAIFHFTGDVIRALNRS